MEPVCLHNPCNCKPARNAEYCCDACASADQSGSQTRGCGCGHAECRPERRAAPPPIPQL